MATEALSVNDYDLREEIRQLSWRISQLEDAIRNTGEMQYHPDIRRPLLTQPSTTFTVTDIVDVKLVGQLAELRAVCDMWVDYKTLDTGRFEERYGQLSDEEMIERTKKAMHRE